MIKCGCRIHRLPEQGRERAVTELFLIMIARNYDKDTADQTRARLASNCWWRERA